MEDSARDEVFYRLLRGRQILVGDPDDQHRLGVKKFKRAVLGFCKESELFGRKTLEDRLCQLGLVDNPQDAKLALNRLIEKGSFRYGSDSNKHYLVFSELDPTKTRSYEFSGLPYPTIIVGAHPE